MRESTWRRGQKADYTDRPLTDEEREFAAEKKNYDLLFSFMRATNLDPEEWYDRLIIPYLNAVKKYCSREELHIYSFGAITTKVLSCAVHHYYRAMYTEKRMPKGGFVFLDYTMEGDNPFSENKLDEFWVDHTQQVERVVLDKAMLEEILVNLDEVQGKIFEMLLEGYNKTEIGKELCIGYTALQSQIDKLKKVVADYLSI